MSEIDSLYETLTQNYNYLQLNQLLDYVEKEPQIVDTFFDNELKIYLQGYILKKTNIDEALKLFENSKYIAAKSQLAEYYYLVSQDERVDIKRYDLVYENCLKAKDVKSKYLLGLLYEYGLYDDMDYEQAFNYYCEAAIKGHDLAFTRCTKLKFKDYMMPLLVHHHMEISDADEYEIIRNTFS